MKFSKRAIFIIIAMIFLGFSNSSFIKTNEWNLYTQSKGVQIFYKNSDCDDVENGLYQKFIIFKIVNTTDFKINVEWKNKLWYNEKCITCEAGKENKLINVILNPKSEIVGDCTNRDLSIFSEFKNHPEVVKLTNFELVELNIKPVL
jgi:hypothetical protein